MTSASTGRPSDSSLIGVQTYPPRKAPTGFLTAGIAVACDRMLEVWKLRRRMEDAGEEVRLRARKEEVARVASMTVVRWVGKEPGTS